MPAKAWGGWECNGQTDDAPMTQWRILLSEGGGKDLNIYSMKNEFGLSL